MKDTDATGNYYCIAHIVQFTGLTDRTIRNYIASGILEGEKINGLWHFTPEQVEAFMRHPAVKPSILAKKNAQIFDFMLDTHKTNRQACIILDLPGEDGKEVSEFFCYSMGEFQNLDFSYDNLNGVPRILLKGDAEEVLRLVNRYYDRQ